MAEAQSFALRFPSLFWYEVTVFAEGAIVLLVNGLELDSPSLFLSTPPHLHPIPFIQISVCSIT